MYENQFNAPRWEQAEHLFLNAGTSLFRIMSGLGMLCSLRDAYFATEHSGNIFHKWLCGKDFRYKFRSGEMHLVTIDTLKDALLSQPCGEWVPEEDVVHTTYMPEGATHQEPDTKQYYKKVDSVWYYYSDQLQGWRRSASLKVQPQRAFTVLARICPGPGKCDDQGCPAHYAGDDPVRGSSDHHKVPPFTMGENFARQKLDMMANPYVDEDDRQNFFTGYASYQRRTYK